METSVLSLLAAAGSAQEPPAWVQFMPFLLMIVVIWFLILRPQMRKQKEHQARIGGIKKGDQVVTGGGLVGKVVKVDEHYVELELGTNVKVKAVKATIADIVAPLSGKPAND